MKIVIKDNAKDVLRETALWYKLRLGQKAKDKFVTGIMSAIRLLGANPRMGRLVEKKLLGPEVEERIFVEHKNHSIIYYIENGILYIADIWNNRMSH